jgi:hypothetical protein
MITCVIAFVERGGIGDMPGMAHQQLLTRLGEVVGIPDLAFDADGHVALSFDDVAIHIEYQEAADALVMTSEVGPLPSVPDAQFLGSLIELNHARLIQRDGSIGIDRGASRIVFIDRVPMHGLTQQLFEDRLKLFIDGVETWRKWLQSPSLAAAEKAPVAGTSDQIFRL